MEKKYWVPAIEKAYNILNLISQSPGQLRLIDLSMNSGINKSSLFSILNTLELLGCIVKEKGDTYTIGPTLGSLGAAYFRQFNILESFFIESEKSVQKIGENIQLGILEGGEVLYLAKKEGMSPVRLATDPGMRFPAYASAIGKVQLSKYTKEELHQLYPVKELPSKTQYTIKTVEQLWSEIEMSKERGYAIEEQEGALGFCCVAAPVLNHENKYIAAVSFTMLENTWESKKEEARDEIIDLANRLSYMAGYKSTTTTNTKIGEPK
jgi:IclR family transcriptional regulator, KDG regulon repressor